MAGTKLGRECRLYRGGAGATWAVPAWLLIENSQDVELPDDVQLAEFWPRSNGSFIGQRPAGQKLSLSFKMTFIDGDADWAALRDAKLNGTKLLVAEANGDIAVTDTQALKFWAYVTKFQEKHMQNGVIEADVEIGIGDADALGNVAEYVVTP